MRKNKSAAMLAAGLIAVALTAAACSSSTTPTTSTSSGPQVQGVTANSITVGTISTQTGPIASNFASLIYGEKAYFDYVNAHGGVNGRKINLAYTLDDGGVASQFNQLSNTLINQDKVYAVTGVATAFFSPNLYAESGIPTYGYNVTGNWATAPNLFAAGGSVQYYPGVVAPVAYLIKHVKATSVAVLSYGIAASSGACQAAITGLRAAGVNVSYTDLQVQYPGSTVSTDVQRMKQVGANFVLSCMDVTGNISMARAIQQYNLKISQLWLNGNDQPVLDQYPSLMAGVYFYIDHVPFTASPSIYPGLAQYMSIMNQYEPKYTLDEVAIQGYESAALFVAGVQAAGNNLSWANLVKVTNQMTDFTAGGLTTPVNWAVGHSGHTGTGCGAFIQVQGTQFVPALGQGKQVFLCFNTADVKNPVPVAPPAGTPGP